MARSKRYRRKTISKALKQWDPLFVLDPTEVRLALEEGSS